MSPAKRKRQRKVGGLALLRPDPGSNFCIVKTHPDRGGRAIQLPPNLIVLILERVWIAHSNDYRVRMWKIFVPHEDRAMIVWVTAASLKTLM